ncbi:MAG: urate hydroxylase PuuD [Deltaproteobacteria bacterium]|nr:urate hydroxylase PuuD [Deltaproteobacteria bacterium]MBI3295603.1 urate hydroxylase PuuD [Deltaproteobacteria bacterium]
MENWGEWVNLLVRWFHIVAAIGWIGSSFFFMWLDSALEKSSDPKIQGSLWMVHSGGFYNVEKRILTKDEIPPNLHWFKWEALLTLISGLFLLGVVYYWGGLMDERSDLPPLGYAAAGFALIALTWLLYDNLWLSPLGKNIPVAGVLTFALIGFITWLGGHFLGPRASYIHVGAAMGTLMVANVWLRILPAQTQMIAAAKQGVPRDARLAERAKMRSIHNNYMTFPVVFIMISNHFPSTYGHSRNWLILLALMVASFCVRHVMNTGRSRFLLGVAALIFAALVASV